MDAHKILAATDAATYVTEVRRLPEGWYAVAAIALTVTACWLVLGMYRREGRRGASYTARLFMAAVRCAVILILALILLDPVRVRIVRRWVDSYTLVMLDSSASMDLTDRYRDDDTLERVRRVLGNDQAASARRMDVAEKILLGEDRRFLKGLAENNTVRLYTFGDEVHSVASMTARSQNQDKPPENPGAQAKPEDANPSEEPRFSAVGATTNLEKAIRQSVETLGSAPIAGVIVLTDGGLNAGGNAEQIARYARDRDVPVHVLGIGDPTAPRNVRVTEVIAPENALQKDPFAITATLTVEGIEGERIRVELAEQNLTDGGEPQIVAAQDVVIGPGGAIAPLTFERRTERVGRFAYTVQVPAVEDESITEDNSRQATVNIVDTSTRALLIAGAPSWTYRYLTTLLQRDDTIDVSCWLQSADMSAVRDGDTIIDHLPSTAEELFVYDVIVLLDPDQTDIDESWCRLVDALVTEHGGGLLYSAARQNAPAFMREPPFKPLVDLLPVSLDPEADLILNQIGHYQTTASPIEVVPGAAEHPILRTSNDAATDRAAWQNAAEVFWHYPVLREKPVATVLLRHGNPRMRNNYGGHVLAAVQYSGAGRTGFLAFDGTWRWRRFGEEWFERFWVQTIRYLAEGKLVGGQGRGSLLVDKDRPALGDAITVTARLLDQRFEPLREDRVHAYYEVDGERRELTLHPALERPGWYEARFVPDQAGRYRIVVPLPGAGETRSLERDIIVSRPNLEIVQPQLHKDAMKMLADQTGGRYWEVDQAAVLTKALPDLHEVVPVRSRPVTLWDNWIVLTLLVGMLSLEWAMRKWNRLL